MAASVSVPTDLQEKSQSLTVTAKALPVIQSADQYREAVSIGRSLRAMSDGITEWWAVPVKEAYQHHKTLVARRDAMLAEVDAALGFVKNRIGTYDQEQERIRQERERQIAAELKKKADEDALAAAVQLEEAGDTLGAEAVVAQQINVPAPPVVLQSTIPIISGKSSRSVWKWRLKDASRLKSQYLIPDEQAISSVVRALKDKAASAIGDGSIEVYEEKSISLRG